MRIVWIVVVVLIVGGLVAWSTTCTGPRPQPTGDTIPTGVTESVIAPTGEG